MFPDSSPQFHKNTNPRKKTHSISKNNVITEYFYSTERKEVRKKEIKKERNTDRKGARKKNERREERKKKERKKKHL